MKITFLGTGTSQGIPVIGCDCKACLSQDPRDKRLRCSVYIQHKDKTFIIDIGPDFRQQLLTHNISKLDFALITHEHNDHTAGLDDVRPLNFKSSSHLDIYTMDRVVHDLKKRFEYVFSSNPYPGAPRINLHTINPEIALPIKGIGILPINIMHGGLPILGFRIDTIAYCTDVSSIDPDQMHLLENLDVLIISALRNKPHYSHLTIEQAIDLSNKVKPKQTYLIHMSHLLGPHVEWTKQLPENFHAAYDGLVVEV